MILAVLTAFLAVVLISLPAQAGEGCVLGLCKGEKVIVYDENRRRVGTIENRGFGVLQFRDNQNRRTGHIDGAGRTYDASRTRTGTIETPSNKWNTPGPSWR